MVSVTMDLDRNAVIATVSGGANPERLAPIVAQLVEATDGGSVVVMDVSDALLTTVHATQRFVTAVLEHDGRASVRVVARRRSARALLRRLGGARLSVHADVEGALVDRPRSAAAV